MGSIIGHGVIYSRGIKRCNIKAYSTTDDDDGDDDEGDDDDNKDDDDDDEGDDDDKKMRMMLMMMMINKMKILPQKLISLSVDTSILASIRPSHEFYSMVLTIL